MFKANRITHNLSPVTSVEIKMLKFEWLSEPAGIHQERENNSNQSQVNVSVNINN